MGQADLGVRVFLIDNLTSPMSILTNSFAMFGSMLASSIGQYAGVGAQLDKLSLSSAELQGKMQGLTNDGNLLFGMLQSGTITEAQYDEAMMRNAASYQNLSTQMDENLAAQAALNTQAE